jgi:hypothetical protein
MLILKIYYFNNSEKKMLASWGMESNQTVLIGQSFHSSARLYSLLVVELMSIYNSYS